MGFFTTLVGGSKDRQDSAKAAEAELERWSNACARSTSKDAANDPPQVFRSIDWSNGGASL